VNKGKAAIIFVDFPLVQLHGYASLIAHEAAHCAGEEGRYWQMHDIIFAQGDVLEQVDPNDEKAAQEALVKLSRGAGVDQDRMRICLQSGKYRPIIASIMQDASNRGIELTPTILVGDEPVQGFLAYKDLKPVIDRQLAKAEKGETGGEAEPTAKAEPTK
jgi:protein-disulfide isomerase